MKYILSKIGAATDQLDWSIRLFLDHQAYVPAIALAGAAEEIVGETLGDQSTFSLLKEHFSAELQLPVKVVSQEHLNKAKNLLKHWQGMRDEETLEMELEIEATQYIIRALTNLISHDRSLPSEGLRFLTWLNENRERLDIDDS